MASVPKTSGSSGGGGKKQPTKRRKMVTGISSNPESELVFLHSDQPGSVSSMKIVQPEHLRCPICQEYPRREVYQCDEGHIVCHSCTAKMTRCPVCRANYPQKKIRSRAVETALDHMQFNCTFKNSGCWETNISRNRRTAHDIQCAHNPSPPGFKLCCLFKNSEACQFKIEPNSIIEDAQHTNDVVEHLTCLPHDLGYATVRTGTGTGMEIEFGLELSYFEPGFKPSTLFHVIDGTTFKTIGYYVLIGQLAVSRENLSFAVVGLNSASVGVNGGNRHNDKITVKFCIKDNTHSKKDGAGRVPDLSWTVNSIYLREWEELVKTSIEDCLPLSYSVPLKLLSEYYVEENGKFDFYMSFGPLVE